MDHKCSLCTRQREQPGSSKIAILLATVGFEIVIGNSRKRAKGIMFKDAAMPKKLKLLKGTPARIYSLARFNWTGTGDN